MSRGFTLVEVLVVLLMLGIAAAVVVPALPRIAEEDPLVRSVDEVTLLLRRARRTALERAAPVYFTVDAEQGRYWVEVHERGEWRELVEGRIVLSPGVSLAAETGRARFVFRSNGSSQGDGLAVLHGSRAMPIAVNPWIGDAGAAR